MTFRSQQLLHYQLLFPRQISYEVMNELGRLDCVHIDDLSDPSNSIYAKQVKRCDDSLHKIQSIMTFIKKNNIQIEKYTPQTDEQFMNKLLLKWDQQSQRNKINQIKRIDQIQQKVKEAWNSYQQLTVRLDRLTLTLNLNKGKMAAFAAASIALGKSYFGANNSDSYDASIEDGQDPIDLSGLSYFVSIIKPEQQQRISKMVFRVSRGYAWTNFIHKSSFQKMPEMDGFNDSVLFLFYPRSSQGVIARKLQRIVQTFSMETVQLPQSQSSFNHIKNSLKKQYEQTHNLLNLIHKQIDYFFSTIKHKQVLDEWYVFLLKQKSLYESLNKMEMRQQFAICRFYIAESKFNTLDKIIRMSPSPILNQLPLKKPPSLFDTNLYTGPGQQIVETYGVPRYGEMNPGVFTSITFPFLFGVMFGDIAHGFVLLMFGVFLVFGAPKLKGGVFNGLLDFRYMILLMGFFAFYCGWIYNDFMGLGLNVFGSCYVVPMYGPGQRQQQLFPKYEGCVYPIGIDPVWYRAQNQLAFINSLKMKISVIIGVIHMTFGIALKAVNSLYFKKKLQFYFQFIPQIIFMVLMFGYMDFLIVFKWFQVWPGSQSYKAPSIITTLINIPLKLGQTTQALGGGNMWGNSINDTSQNTIQLFILLISLICIPVMLIPKPWIQIRRMNNPPIKPSPLQQQLLGRESQVTQQFQSLKQEINEQQQQQHSHHEDKSEIIVHQIIQTIQFILGCISNTASYLRLWALSLAHSQLSRVFFDKTIQAGFKSGYATIMTLFLGFYLLAYVTFGVLMCMDTMQCFLHSLRLHWVEFQNKFFKADGIKFNQFSFKRVVQKAKSDE